MQEMTTHERFTRMFQHRQADRIPIIDSPWRSTVERWWREGMPQNVDWTDYFGCDHRVILGVDTSPRYPVKVLEETDEYSIATSGWGVTMKNWKHANSTPAFLNFTITDPDSWAAAKKRMTPSRDRIDWARLEKEYRTWRQKGYWLECGFWFGYDVLQGWIVGTERMLMALADKPDWCVEMFNCCLDMSIAQFEMILDAGYKFDAMHWCDDLGYKHHQFMSMRMYRKLLKPVHERAIDWAHSKGMYACMHSCGDVHALVPEWVEMGLDCLDPLEVKAGMNPVDLKEQFGDKLVLRGGINAVLWDNLDAILAEMEKTVPTLKQDGGYVFSSDHSVPSSVSLANFRHIIEKAKQLGAY